RAGARAARARAGRAGVAAPERRRARRLAAQARRTPRRATLDHGPVDPRPSEGARRPRGGPRAARGAGRGRRDHPRRQARGAVGVGTGATADPHHAWFHFGGFLWPLFSWDFGWYHSIALRGYPVAHAGREYAFFPLWPLLLSWSGPIATWVVAFVLSLVASAGAFVAVGAANPRRRVWQSAVALACWPGSFALLLAYPDALALAAAAGAAALVWRGRPIPAAVLAALAVAARPNAFLIAIPLAAIARGRSRIYWLAVAAPLAVTVAVHAYFWERSGVWDAFVRAQSHWHRGGPGTFRTWASHISHALERHWTIVIPLA